MGLIMKNKKTYFLFGIIVAVMIIKTVSAFGVASVYSSTNPLKMYPGETKIIPLTLGTTSAEGDLTIKAEMLDNAEIASFVDNNLIYKVNVGQEIPVNVKIVAGNDVLIGEEKIISIKFYDITPSAGGGMIALGNAQTTTLKVFVVEKPSVIEETPATTEVSLIWGILGIIAVVAIIAVIWFVAKSRKE